MKITKSDTLLSATVALIILSGCAHRADDATSAMSSKAQAEKTRSVSPHNALSTTSVSQIPADVSDSLTPQIARSVDTQQLTIDQLKAYADRCAPGQTNPTNDIDCSELSLRVKTLFRSDDKVQEALITLDRLGRSGSNVDVDDELRRNRGDLSFSAQAIANGTLTMPMPAELPEDPIDDDLEKFLNQNGFGVNAGVIVNQGG